MLLVISWLGEWQQYVRPALSRYYKQAKVMQIVEGTSEVQRIVITRNLSPV